MHDLTEQVARVVSVLLLSHNKLVRVKLGHDVRRMGGDDTSLWPGLIS